MVSAALVVGTYYLAVIIPKGFLPSEDIDQINGTTEAIEGISFDAMVEHQKQIAEILAKDPSVAYVLSSIGSGGRTLNQGGLNIRLKPRVRAPAGGPGHQRVAPQACRRARDHDVPAQRSSDPHRRTAKQGALPVHDAKPEHEGALQLRRRISRRRCSALPGLTDVSSDLQIRNPQINVEIDRDAASSYGVTVNQIEDAMYSAYGQRQISTIFAPNNQYWVILELEPEYQRDANKIASLYVHSATDRRISQARRAARAAQRRGETHSDAWARFR